MKKISYWDDFYTSGRIEDYLAFRAVNTDNETKNSMADKQIRTGDDPNAGFCNGNGNDHKDDSFW